MIDWLLRQMPEMLARYEYMQSLLRWLQEWINEVKKDKPAFPWVLPSPLLMTSLERAAQELKSIKILRFLVEVQKQIDELNRVNQEGNNDGLAIQALMNLGDNVPRLESQLKTELVKSGIMAWLFFLILLALLMGATVLLWIKVVKEVSAQCALFPGD